MKIGNKDFDVENHAYVMGILNVTPDSFSDGGKWNDLDAALKHTEEMLTDGADIIDIGGESTRPGYTRISCREELFRVLPVLSMIKETFRIPVSVDTYKAEVARETLAAGADMINDIWGLMEDTEMAGVIADSGAACCLMHNRREASYTDLIPEMNGDFERILQKASEAGIASEKIIMDPGIGFAKSYEDNMRVLAHLEDFKAAGYPMLLGSSRKSVIGLTLDLPAGDRLEGTLATTALAVMAGYGFVRVHDIAANVRMIRMLEAVRGFRDKQ